MTNEREELVSDDTHEIYAIKYGRHERKKAENYIGGDPHDGPEPIDYFVWAIKGPSGSFVVDTGFDEPMAKKRGRVISHPIAEGTVGASVDRGGGWAPGAWPCGGEVLIRSRRSPRCP